MKLYTVKIVETGEELCVGARTADHAAEVLVTFWAARSGTMPGTFEVEPGAPVTFRDNSFVRLVAAGELAGVIVRQMDGSMLFEAAGS